MSIKNTIEADIGGIVVDKKFYRDFISMEQAFVNKKPEHIEFFGGTLTGVQTVRFTSHEFDLFFGDLLMIDEALLSDKLHDLPDINPEFKVSSSVFNLVSVWLMHKALTSEALKEDEREELAVRVATYMYYHFLTSILFNFFKYPANPDTAKATYAAMSYRFILKSEGSWSAAIRYRAKHLVDKDSIWRADLETMSSDKRIVELINSANGSIKSMVKYIYELFMTVHNSGKRIKSSSTLVEFDGEIQIRDKTKGLLVYDNYIRSVSSNFGEFYKQELFEVICSVMHTASEHLLLEFMKWFTANYFDVRGGKPEKIISAIMEHAFEYLAENTELIRKRESSATILKKMKGTYTSSIASNVKLMKIKEDVDAVIKSSIRVKDASSIASLRTAFCLYVILRAFTMKHYQGG